MAKVTMPHSELLDQSSLPKCFSAPKGKDSGWVAPLCLRAQASQHAHSPAQSDTLSQSLQAALTKYLSLRSLQAIGIYCFLFWS